MRSRPGSAGTLLRFYAASTRGANRRRGSRRTPGTAGFPPRVGGVRGQGPDRRPQPVALSTTRPGGWHSAVRPAKTPAVRSHRWPLLLLAVAACWVLPALPAEAAGVYPVDGPVVRGFDPPAQRWQPGHRGVDLLAPPGAPVRAAAAGRVGFAGEVAGKPVVTVWHGSLRTTYEPVRAAVRPGDLVAAGQVIGELQAGHACGARQCLHWGLRRGDHYLDPLLLVTRPRVRLLSAEAVATIRHRLEAGAGP